jgi:hypothetical protein
MSAQPPVDPFRSYLRWCALSALLVCAVAFAINAVVDPLWHFAGNLVTGVNPHFNERQSKINLLRRHAGDYDCVIFGSSRGTLMPGDAFAPHRCFNLAFASGQIEEFNAYADYLKHIGVHPSLVVVGVDGFNFMREGRDTPVIPDFVREGRDPPGALRDYLSIGSLEMSMQSLFEPGTPRHYDRDFNCVIRADAPHFDPANFRRAEGLQRRDAERRRQIPFVADNARLYGELAARFPHARVIAYVPPISAWRIDDMARRGVLDGYTDALYASAQHFARMIDFSVPDARTARTDNTYDGSHYSLDINRDIARQLLDPAPPAWGVDMTGLGRDVYLSRYRQALLAFRDSQLPRAAAPDQ